MARALNDNPPVPLTASMPYRLRQEIVELARRDGVSLSAEVRAALELLLQARAAEQSQQNIVSA
jgi:hypothetical protein